MNCSKHISNIKSALRNGGLKVTPARLELLDIFAHAKRPLRVKDVQEKLGEKVADTATLYRNMESLEKSGILAEVHIDTQSAYYELTHAAHHHHLVCEKCGRVSDVQACGVPVINQKELERQGFGKLSRHSLEFFGVCFNCLKH